MSKQLHIYNTLSRKKELFKPIHEGRVGLYVCGPTVYGKAHLGHARPAVTFDLLFRYLKQQGYKVRYVRNITDVGHLVNDADEGEDKIAQKARLDELEPMEIAQKYTNDYHNCMRELRVLPPSIEPRATGHILEQIALVEQIMQAGYAYESQGSVYFDVEKYAKDFPYGELSGRKIEDLQANTRQLDGQNEKRAPLDFAIWKKASPEHIMRWPSKWSEGFPGWHLECTTMGCKYLGQEFDIHGGGMDLTFPHHEAEIAQSKAAYGHASVKYWMHNNMITLNGQKMGKSLGNAISLEQFFSGEHDLLDKAYRPMVIRFFMLTAHYRSTLDFSNEALQAAEKGMDRLLKTCDTLEKINASAESTVQVHELRTKCFEAMNDDLNTPIAIAHLFDGVKMINLIADGKASVSTADLAELKELYHIFLIELFGLERPKKTNASAQALDVVMDLVLQVRTAAKANKDWNTADKIRDKLSAAGIVVKDTTDGADWEFN